MKVANLQMDEILQAVNDSSDVELELRSALAAPYTYLRHYLMTLLSDSWPSFEVELIEWKHYGYHRSMAGAFLLSKPTWNIFSGILMNSNAKLKAQEFQCKALLEMLCEGEANILVCILTKNLQKLYPNITHEMLNKVL